MPTRDVIAELLVEKCKTELDYYELVNERTETIDYRAIVELVLQSVFDVWGEEDAN